MEQWVPQTRPPPIQPDLPHYCPAVLDQHQHPETQRPRTGPLHGLCALLQLQSRRHHTPLPSSLNHSLSPLLVSFTFRPSRKSWWVSDLNYVAQVPRDGWSLSLLLGWAALLVVRRRGKDEGARWSQRTDRKLLCLLGPSPQRTLSTCLFLSQAVLMQQVGDGLLSSLQWENV